MAGGDDGFDEFAAGAWPRLRRSAYLLTGDHHLAEDLTQTALARTFAHWRRVRRQDALAYSRKVLVNLNIDRLRRRRMVEVGGNSAEHALDRVADREDPNQATSDRDHVVRLLAVLTDKERRVVVLRHYFDLSEADVAGELGIAPGTVKSTLSRALAKLRVSDDSLEEAVGGSTTCRSGELEDELHTGEREVLDTRTLATIRRHGGRRRTARRALTAVGTAGVVAVVGLTLALGGVGGDERTKDDSVQVADPPPHELSRLAQRALDEIPGAVQVSDWQVVVPSPDAKSDYWMGDPPDQEVVGDTVPLDAKSYQGVTMFPARSWPGWLYDGTLDYEQSQKDENGSYPVGSTGTGILVEVGGAELACVSAKNYACGPAVMTRTSDGKLHFEWGMGTDEFLTPGSGMEVFLDEDYSTGAPGTLAFAGLPGTDVARVEFVTTSGQVVEGQVHTGLVEGASMMSARVPGDLAKVVAYDASGEVIEDHPLNQCDSPVECEVR